MLDNIFAFLRFLTDPETRGTINAISNVLSPSGKNWKKQIKTVSAKFPGDNPLSVTPFVNSLLKDYKQIGISPREIEKFTTIFNELIHNAFEHGCKGFGNCTVIVRCTYSPWFIRLEISDKGGGFDFNKLIERELKGHGLSIVKKLAYRLTTNERGNSITAYIVDDELDIHSTVEKYDAHEILIVNVSSKGEWNYLVKTWEPLDRIVRQAPQRLVIIDCLKIFEWDTVTVRGFKKTVSAYHKQAGRIFALLAPSSISETFDLLTLRSANFEVFEINRQTRMHPQEQARKWLLDRAKE